MRACTVSLCLSALALCVMTEQHTGTVTESEMAFAWLSVSSACLPAAACFNRACLRKREKDRESREIAKDMPVCFPLNFGSVSAAAMHGGFQV
jgi:mevalonate pyrophosphate decarboxylase